MVTVKLSGEASKSALPAVSAAARTGTTVGTARVPPPGNRAVTVTGVVRDVSAPASSLMRWGLTPRLMRWSSSLICRAAEAPTMPWASAEKTMVSVPSANSSSGIVTSQVPVIVGVLAGNVASWAPVAVKSLPAAAAPPPTVRVTAVSAAGGVVPVGHPNS